MYNIYDKHSWYSVLREMEDSAGVERAGVPVRREF